MNDDIFKVHEDDWRGHDEPALFERLFAARPRLVPKTMVWLMPVLALTMVWVTSSITGRRLADVSETETGWRVAMMLITLAPWMILCALPVVQRRHLTNPHPFYTFCRWATFSLAVVIPVLLIAGWMLGPGSPWTRGAPAFFTILMYTIVMALYPVAARHNHAAWLRIQQGPPPPPPY